MTGNQSVKAALAFNLRWTLLTIWRAFLRGHAKTVFGPLGLCFSVPGALASVALLLIAVFDSPSFSDLQKISGTLTRPPQLMSANKRPPWIEIFMEGEAKIFIIETASLKKDMVRDVLSLSPGIPITAWVKPGIPSHYLVIWQLHGTTIKLKFDDLSKAHRNSSLSALKLSGSFIAIGLIFLWIEVVAWRRNQKSV